MCLHVTSLVLSTSTLHMLRTSVMEIPKIQDCQYAIVLAANIKILAPQKLAKACPSDTVKFTSNFGDNFSVRFWIYFSSSIFIRLVLFLTCVDYVRHLITGNFNSVTSASNFCKMFTRMYISNQST